MNELFLKIVNMSISASWLVLAVLILRIVLKKTPKWSHVLLWGIVAVRLLCPFSIESSFSLIPSSETIPAGIELDRNPAVDSGITVINYVVNPIIRRSFTPDPLTSVNPLQIVVMLCTNIWVLGMIMLLIYTVISYWRIYRKVDTAVLLRDNIFQSEHAGSPFVLGIIKPKIYLPFKMNGQSLEHVIAHEKAHIRRKDHWWKPLGFLLLVLHWFNPLMWLAYTLLCRDIELACDEKVIQKLGSEERADYTQALLVCSIKQRMITACPLAFGEVGVKERVRSVMNYKKPSFWIIIGTVLICAVMAMCFLTDPKKGSYDIRIVVPAGSQEQFVYSDEEISPYKNKITVSSGDNLGDTEVVLKPVEVQQEKTYEPEYMTPGLPVKLKVEKGAWYQIGINMQNPTDEDIIVYVNVKEVEVRIADAVSTNIRKWFDYTEDPSEMDWDHEITIEIPEFQGVTFRYTPEQIIASKPFTGTEMNGHTILLNGMPIWNAYFSDLTGDGLPDICASYSWGSGMIDNRIIICDYANGASYELSERGNYDYYLRLNEEDGELYVDKKVYNSEELVSSGRLVFKEECIQIEYEADDETEQSKKYYMTIGAEGVTYIQVSTPDTSGGCQNADGSPFKKGETFWLENLDGIEDLRGVTIEALNAKGEVVWSTSIPDGEENQGFRHFTQDGWTITNME